MQRFSQKCTLKTFSGLFWFCTFPWAWAVHDQNTAPQCLAGRVLCTCSSAHLLACCEFCVLWRSVLSDSLRPQDCGLPSSSHSWIFPGQNTGVGCHFLLQGSSQPRDQTHVSWVFFTPEPPELWLGDEEWAAAAELSWNGCTLTKTYHLNVPLEVASLW